MQVDPRGTIISTILRHDAKTTSYKIALLRAINDVVLAFPDVGLTGQAIAVPLRMLAERWVAYYWPFVDEEPIWQGPRNRRTSGIVNDMAFRPILTRLKGLWQQFWGLSSQPADGFMLVNEMRIARRRSQYPVELIEAYEETIAIISSTLEMPVRYAGPGQWTVFRRPASFGSLHGSTPLPGTQARDRCLLVAADLWVMFRQLSLWVEALCIHEWCLFTERVDQNGGIAVDRGDVYRLLTDRPDNRRPLTWEQNQVDLLLLEGEVFTCPWTQRCLGTQAAYDIDHLIPIAVYPMNELWNLVPCDREFNQHIKRDRLPDESRLQVAEPILAGTYCTYLKAEPLSQALREDVISRFATVTPDSCGFAPRVATATTAFLRQVADSRNLARF